MDKKITWTDMKYKKQTIFSISDDEENKINFSVDIFCAILLVKIKETIQFCESTFLVLKGIWIQRIIPALLIGV